jgi:hypothetical protein
MVGAIPELAPLQELLDGAARGLQFPDALGTSIIPLMQELAQASGARRVVLMMSVLEQLASCPNAGHWPGPGYDLNAQRHMSSTINQVLSYIRQNLGGNLRETDVAELAAHEREQFYPLLQAPYRLHLHPVPERPAPERSLRTADVHRTERDRGVLPGGLQQPVQFQSPVPGLQGHAALAFPLAAPAQ